MSFFRASNHANNSRTGSPRSRISIGPAFRVHEPAVRIDADGVVDRVGDVGRATGRRVT